jgi:hypothetical protein
MLQCNFHYHEKLNKEKMRELLAQWRADAAKEA